MNAERRYKLTRISVGDYLLPSNDARTLWRVYAYEEDGSATVQGKDGRDRPLRGRWWSTAKYAAPLLDLGLLPDDFLDWCYWTVWDTCLASREAAIGSALR